MEGFVRHGATAILVYHLAWTFARPDIDGGLVKVAAPLRT